MKKVLALILALVMALSLVACGGSGNSGDDGDTYYEWSLSCEYSEENHQTKALKDAAALIEEKTDGHIKITVYPNMALGDYTVVYGQVISGDIEMCANPISTQYDPRVDVMNMPFLAADFEAFESEYLDHDSYMWKLFDDVTSNNGTKLLGFLNAGFMGLGMKSIDSDSFADLTGSATKSQLMRAPAADSYNLTMKAMGYNTTVIPYSDLYSAMQNGLCEGWLGGSGLVNYDSFRDAIKYFVDCNVINECIPVMMNAKLFNSLSEEYQQIIVDVFSQTSVRVNDERAQQEAQAVTDLNTYGVKVIQPTEAELSTLRDNVRASVWPKMAGVLGQDVIDELCQTYGVKLS